MRLRRHLSAMPGATLVDVCCEYMTEVAIVLVYGEQRFAIELLDDQFEFSVADAQCPQDLKDAVLRYADEMLACPSPSDG